MGLLLPWLIMLATLALIVIFLIFGFKGEHANGTGKPQKARIPKRPDQQPQFSLREQLIQAGFYREGVVKTLRTIRIAAVILAAAGGVLIYMSSIASLTVSVLCGLIAVIAATIAPAFLLEALKRRRQKVIRRALPDALDVIVICLEAGVSLPSAFARVSHELNEVHPQLSLELCLVEREVQLGRRLGDALWNFAARFDLEELRSLAGVVSQSDQYGSSVIRAFKIFSESLRQKRQQQAEEAAHKASIKLAFPTVIFILPAMIVVTMAPAILQLMQMIVPMFTEVEVPQP